MRRAHLILTALALGWVMALLTVSSDIGYGDDGLITGILLAGVALALAWLGVAVADLLRMDRRRNRLSAFAPLFCQAGIVAGGIALSFTDLPFRVRFQVSEPALTAFATGRAERGQVGLFRIRSVDRETDTVYLVCGHEGGLAYSTDGAPLESPVNHFQPIQGPWYRWISTF